MKVTRVRNQNSVAAMEGEKELVKTLDGGVLSWQRRKPGMFFTRRKRRWERVVMVRFSLAFAAESNMSS